MQFMLQLQTLYKHKFGAFEVKLREDKLKCDLQWQQNIFAVMTKTNKEEVEASFPV